MSETRQYFLDHPSGNLSWCRPYRLTVEDKTLTVAVNEGKIVGISPEPDNFDNKDYNNSALLAIADTFNVPKPDSFGDLFNYNDYNAIDSGTEELGCCNCPFFLNCDAINDDSLES